MPAPFLELSIHLAALAWLAATAKCLPYMLPHPGGWPQIEVLSIENHLLQRLHIILSNCTIFVDSCHHSPDSLLEREGVSPFVSQRLQGLLVVSWGYLLLASLWLTWGVVNLSSSGYNVWWLPSRLFILPLCLYILLNLVKVPN